MRNLGAPEGVPREHDTDTPRDGVELGNEARLAHVVRKGGIMVRHGVQEHGQELLHHLERVSTRWCIAWLELTLELSLRKKLRANFSTNADAHAQAMAAHNISRQEEEHSRVQPSLWKLSRRNGAQSESIPCQYTSSCWDKTHALSTRRIFSWPAAVKSLATAMTHTCEHTMYIQTCKRTYRQTCMHKRAYLSARTAPDHTGGIGEYQPVSHHDRDEETQTKTEIW